MLVIGTRGASIGTRGGLVANPPQANHPLLPHQDRRDDERRAREWMPQQGDDNPQVCRASMPNLELCSSHNAPYVLNGSRKHSLSALLLAQPTNLSSRGCVAARRVGSCSYRTVYIPYQPWRSTLRTPTPSHTPHARLRRLSHHNYKQASRPEGNLDVLRWCALDSLPSASSVILPWTPAKA